MSSLRDEFAARRATLLVPLAVKLEAKVKAWFDGIPRIDRIAARAKAVDRFVDKASKKEGGIPKYTDPLNQIQDQIGARIVTFYKSDVGRVEERIRKYFGFVEAKRFVPDSDKEFGYEGVHFIALIPQDLFETEAEANVVPFFELQVKTLFQHAWSESNHDLGYKPETELTWDQRRQLAFTAAQAWGADRIFDEMFRATQKPATGTTN